MPRPRRSSPTSVADVAPPAGVRAALLAQIAATPPRIPTPHPRSAEPALRADRRSTPPATEPAKAQRWRPRSWFALAASLALLVGVGWGAVFVGQQLNTPASVVALDQIESAPDAQSETVALADGGEVTAHWSESIGKAVLVSDGLPSIADDESFELWVVRDGAAIIGRHLHRRRRHGDRAAGRRDRGRRRDRRHRRAGRGLADGTADDRPDRRDRDRLSPLSIRAGSLER